MPGEDDQARLHRLALIFEHATDAIVGKTLEGIITDWNPAAERIYGWPAAEAIGRDIEFIFPPGRKHELDVILGHLRRGEDVEHHDTERLRKDGTVFPALVGVYPIRNRAGRVIGGNKTAIDLTAIRRRERAEEALRLRDEILASLAHDLQQPLATIRGQAQLLQRRLARGAGAPDVPGLLAGLQVIDATTGHLSSQITGMLDEARVDAGRPLALDAARTDLVALVRQVVEEYARSTETHAIRFECALPALVGAFDAGRLRRVLGNLLSNAVKYSPAGGEIVARVAREAAPQGEVRGGAHAVVAVRDQGAGIPAAELARVFEPRYRAVGAAQLAPGAGLGLASARAIVERHGGTLAAESSPGGGSTFTVRLPVTGTGVP